MKGIDKTFLEPKLYCLDLLYKTKSDSIQLLLLLMILHIPIRLDTGKEKDSGFDLFAEIKIE